MSATGDASLEVYLVPFGREPRGYLDLLGLPPDATNVEAAKREGEYRKDLERELKERRKELRDAHKKGDLSQQELDERTEQLEATRTARLTELGALKAKYDAIVSERRKLTNAGRKDDNVVWLEMYGSFAQDAEIWDFLLSPRAPGPLARSLLDEVKSRWVTSVLPHLLVPAGWVGYLGTLGLPPGATDAQVRNGEAEFPKVLQRELAREGKVLEARHAQGDLSRQDLDEQLHRLEVAKSRRLSGLDILRHQHATLRQQRTASGGGLPSATAQTGSIDLATLSALTAERDLIALLNADALWGEVGSTNRSYWSAKVADWLDELATLGPRLRPAQAAAFDGTTDFPALARPMKRSIDRLEAGIADDSPDQPDRSRKQATPSIDDVLARLAEGRAGGLPENLDEFRDLLARLLDPALEP